MRSEFLGGLYATRYSGETTTPQGERHTVPTVYAIERAVNAGWAQVAHTPGYLSEREARFLMTALAAVPVAGANVEIGSFKGRSTVGLATVARYLDLEPIVAIDPHTSPASTDPDLKGSTSSFEEFLSNVARARATSHVDVRRAFSGDVAKTWTDPIRFLWIDGDHTYEGAHADVTEFEPFLVPGAIVAMHDVLSTFEGCLRVFLEDILKSDDFGQVGYCGSIGWAQYRPGQGASFTNQLRRSLLAIPTAGLARLARHGRTLHGWHKYVYKFWRPLAPHGDVRLERLCAQLALE